MAMLDGHILFLYKERRGGYAPLRGSLGWALPSLSLVTW